MYTWEGGSERSESLYILVHSSPIHEEPPSNMREKTVNQGKVLDDELYAVAGWCFSLMLLGEMGGYVYGVGRGLQMSIWCQEEKVAETDCACENVCSHLSGQSDHISWPAWQ